jgi:hypothetical protein
MAGPSANGITGPDWRWPCNAIWWLNFAAHTSRNKKKMGDDWRSSVERRYLNLSWRTICKLLGEGNREPAHILQLTFYKE